MSDTKIYVWVLDMEKLQGRRNCDIFYVRHSGDFEKFSREALRRNITITSISIREYKRVMRGGAGA